MTLTKSEARVVAELLDEAADVFSNHGCNDFDLAAHMPAVEERRDLMRKYHEHNGDPEEFDPESEYRAVSADWALMHYFAARLRGRAK